jgi:hypothetical protein
MTEISDGDVLTDIQLEISATGEQESAFDCGAQTIPPSTNRSI